MELQRSQGGKIAAQEEGAAARLSPVVSSSCRRRVELAAAELANRNALFVRQAGSATGCGLAEQGRRGREWPTGREGQKPKAFSLIALSAWPSRAAHETMCRFGKAPDDRL